GLLEPVLNIVRIVGELHEHGVIASAAATGEGRIVLRRAWIVGELHEHGVIAGAAATGEARIVLRRARVVGELRGVADAAATGEGWIVLSRIVGVGGNDAAQRLTLGYVELVARTNDNRRRAKLARTELSNLSCGVAFALARYDLKGFCVDIDAVVVRDTNSGLLRVSGCKH